MCKGPVYSEPDAFRKVGRDEWGWTGMRSKWVRAEWSLDVAVSCDMLSYRVFLYPKSHHTMLKGFLIEV